MTTTWLLVAQGSKAVVITAEDQGENALVLHEFAHDDARKKAGDLMSDRQGRTYQSSGPIRHAMDPNEELKEHGRKVFAKEIASFLFKAHNNHEFHRLIIAASHDLLGSLRAELAPSVKGTVAHELSKDLMSQFLTPDQLVKRVISELNLAKF